MNTRTAPKVQGVCRICGKRTTNAVVVRGKTYTDQDGVVKRAADTLYHRECRSMQNRGLLNAGADRPHRDSSGSRCGGCNSVIESGDRHAHRNGQPYHRECLV